MAHPRDSFEAFASSRPLFDLVAALESSAAPEALPLLEEVEQITATFRSVYQRASSVIQLRGHQPKMLTHRRPSPSNHPKSLLKPVRSSPVRKKAIRTKPITVKHQDRLSMGTKQDANELIQSDPDRDGEHGASPKSAATEVKNDLKPRERRWEERMRAANLVIPDSQMGMPEILPIVSETTNKDSHIEAMVKLFCGIGSDDQFSELKKCLEHYEENPFDLFEIEAEQQQQHDSGLEDMPDLIEQADSSGSLLNSIRRRIALSKLFRLYKQEASKFQGSYRERHAMSKLVECSRNNSDAEERRLMARRLTAARKWNEFTKIFGVSILVIIPFGGVCGMSNERFERLTVQGFRTVAELLNCHRGEYLRTICRYLSGEFTEGLCGAWPNPQISKIPSSEEWSRLLRRLESSAVGRVLRADENNGKGNGMEEPDSQSGQTWEKMAETSNEGAGEGIELTTP